MDFFEVTAKRRSVRRFSAQSIPQQVIDRIVDTALHAPSSRNSHSSRLILVEERTTIERLAASRDYGSSFMAAAPLVMVVLGDKTVNDKWMINATITATYIQLAAVAEGLSSCWVHLYGSLCRKDEPQGKKADEFAREVLGIAPEQEILCAIAIGASDFTPAPLPEYDYRKDVKYIR